MLHLGDLHSFPLSIQQLAPLHLSIWGKVENFELINEWDEKWNEGDGIWTLVYLVEV